jgi:predicted ATPase
VRKGPDRRPFGPGPYVRGARIRWDDVDPDAFPFTLPAVRALDGLRLDAPVTFLVGENGAGKSTLIEALAQALRFDASGGTLGTELGPRNIGGDDLGAVIDLDHGPNKPRNAFFLRAESFFNVAKRIDAEELSDVYGGRDLHAQSHGESFLALAGNRFGGEGLYVLDEPEAALSVTSALAFLAVMQAAADAGAQFIVATHSPILLALPGARIYELDEDGATETEWEDCDPTRLMRAFLDAPDRFLRELTDP